MGRPRRKLNQFGELLCNRCGNWKHLDDYYYPSEGPVWYIVELTSGKELHYRKPSSWCKTCIKASSRTGSSDQAPERVRSADVIKARAEQARSTYEFTSPPTDNSDLPGS